MAVNLWAERALPYWLRNERSFTIFFDLARIFQEWPTTTGDMGALPCVLSRRTWKAEVTVPDVGSVEFVFDVIY
ncbi:MAG: hypothetical protein V3U56_07495 [Syntrophobacteria bacterium]